MTTVEAQVDKGLSISVREVTETDVSRILEGYALLQSALGVDRVEDLEAFWRTVSPNTDAWIVPKLVGATHQGRLVGFTVGVYLRRLCMGFIAYSGVDQTWRRCGVYSRMRAELLALFDQGAALDGHRVAYVISEQDEESPLLEKYLTEWGSFVLPCAYEQPDGQGLRRARLKLVLQPLARPDPPSRRETESIVREIYERIYRISDVTENSVFQGTIASLRCPDMSTR